MRAFNKALATLPVAVLITHAIIASAAFAQNAPVTAADPAYRAPRTLDGKPDLSGIWQALNTANWDLEGQGGGPSPVVELGAIGATPPGLGATPAADEFGPAARIALTAASIFWTPVAAFVVVPRMIAAANASSRAGAP